MNLSLHPIPVSTRRRFDVYTTSITLKRRRMDVKITLCAYWDISSVSSPVFRTENTKGTNKYVKNTLNLQNRTIKASLESNEFDILIIRISTLIYIKRYYQINQTNVIRVLKSSLKSTCNYFFPR